MKKLIYLITILFIFIGCSQGNDNEIPTYSQCLKNQIEIYLKNSSKPTGEKGYIKKYTYKGEVVYLVDFYPDSPDSSAGIVNVKCEIICSLGGIDGSQNDCLDWDKAVFIETVWTDPR